MLVVEWRVWLVIAQKVALSHSCALCSDPTCGGRILEKSQEQPKLFLITHLIGRK